ncbi:MAG: MBL fold metallo-hydrolase [Thermodesulfovibrionales bacterium]|nr:MBL fold metallo-hydrolase [Thermodesulfovibrionales bacterium]
MKVICLKKSKKVYSANAYLVLGDWNTLEDVNTLIDVGTDDTVVSEIETINTGVGKKRIDQVILTHNHFDHSGGVFEIKRLYNSKVLAYSDSPYVDERLKDGQEIRIGDRYFEVIHCPFHSSDSICLLCKTEGVLFSGDTPIRVLNKDVSYDEDFCIFLERLIKADLKVIYSGHDKPLRENVKEVLQESLKHVSRKSGCRVFL